VVNTARSGLAEVELAKLAQEKGTSARVKTFAQRMTDDHGKANAELESLAQNKKITMATAMSANEKALKTRLSKLSGDAFDCAYMNAMLQDHRSAVAAFKREANTGKDPDIKAFASKTLPTLEDHLKLAQETHKTVGTTGTRPSKKTGK